MQQDRVSMLFPKSLIGLWELRKIVVDRQHNIQSIMRGSAQFKAVNANKLVYREQVTNFCQNRVFQATQVYYYLFYSNCLEILLWNHSSLGIFNLDDLRCISRPFQCNQDLYKMTFLSCEEKEIKTEVSVEGENKDYTIQSELKQNA